MTDQFKGLKDKINEITIRGEKIKIIPKVKDAEMFVCMKKEMTDKDASKITQTMKEIIKRGNPESDEKDIEAFVTINYGELLKQLSIKFGFATEKDFTDMRERMLKD